MQTNTIDIVTKGAFARGWTDIEPKVVAFFATGGLLTIAAWIANLYGFHFQGWQEAGIIWLSSTIAGYIKTSSVRLPAGGDTSATATLISASDPVVIQPAAADDLPENVFDEIPAPEEQ